MALFGKMIQYGGDMGKKDKSSAKNKASWRYFWFWLLTLGFFWLILFAVKFDFSENSSGAWLVLFLLNILLGIVFFLRFIGNLFQSFKNKDKKEPIRYGFAALALIILFFTSFYTASPIAKAYFAPSNSKVKGEQTANDPAKLAQPIEETSSEKSKPSINNSNSVNINTVECIGPDGKHFSTTLEECTALNEKWGEEVNYMVDCPIHQSCGGGTKRMTKKECDNSICCQIGPNWIFYTSREMCIQDQKTQDGTTNNSYSTDTGNSPNKVPVYLTYRGYTIYCPSQNISAIQAIDADMKSKNSKWVADYNNCADIFYKNDECWVSCYDTQTNQLNSCYSRYGYSGDGYTSCKESAFEGYRNCIKSCPSASKECDYVYWEQKDLSSQIDNLCK